MTLPKPFAAVLLLSLLAIACGGGASRQVRFDTRSGLETRTPDGLQRIQSTRLGAAFVRPGADLSAYERVVIGQTGVVAGPPSGQTGSLENRPMDEDAQAADRKRMAELVQAAVETELARSAVYAVVAAGSAGVLHITPAVLDFSVDTRQSPGGEWNVGGSVGEMTLVLEVRDAASGAPLVRLVERPELRLQTGVGGATVQGPGSVWSLVRRAVNQWVEASREELDTLHDARIPPLP